MKISKVTTNVPLRISIAGGGSDIYEFFSKHGGHFYSAAIDLYINIKIKKRSDNLIIITERFPSSTNLNYYSKYKTPGIIGSIIKRYDHSGLDITIESQIRPKSGLGGSGAFCVGMIIALDSLFGIQRNSYEVALLAYEIERIDMGVNTGYQDQIIAAHGGIIECKITPNGNISLSQMGKSFKDKFNQILNKNVVLVPVGKTRSAKTILNEMTTMISNEENKSVEKLKSIKDMSEKIIHAIEIADEKLYGNLLLEHWKYKKSISVKMYNAEIEQVEKDLENNNVIGYKLIGAGGGGYFLAVFNNEDKEKSFCDLLNKGYLCHTVELENIKPSVKIYNELEEVI